MQTYICSYKDLNWPLAKNSSILFKGYTSTGGRYYFYFSLSKDSTALESSIYYRECFDKLLSILGFNLNSSNFASTLTGDKYANIFEPGSISNKEFFDLVKLLFIIHDAKNAGRYFTEISPTTKLQLLDVVEIKVDPLEPPLRFIVQPLHLMDVDVSRNNKGRIFTMLNILNRNKFAGEVYGYNINSVNEFPLYKHSDFYAALKMLLKLTEIAQEKMSNCDSLPTTKETVKHISIDIKLNITTKLAPVKHRRSILTIK